MMKHLSFPRIAAIILMIVVLSGCSSLLQAEAPTAPETQVVEVVVTATPEPVFSRDNQPAVEPPTLPESAPQAAPLVPQVQEAPSTAPMLDLFAQEQAFVSVYERVNPAVVNINIGIGQGSGFVYNEQGYIVTNNHVVEGASRIVVTFYDGTQKDARLVGTDPDSDLAVIKVDAAPGELTAIQLADSEALKVGQFVIAIGNPFGLQNSMTTGIVSGLGRLLEGAQSPTGASYNIPDIVQTDAAINPGNSGGPLLDLNGRLIGVNSAIASPVRASSGVGYAVPSNIVKVVVPQLIADGRVDHPWLGISGATLTADAASALGLDTNLRGVLVSTVTPNGPAALAGLVNSTNSSADVIVGIDGMRIEEFDDLLSYIVQHTQVGQTVTLSILRNGRSADLPLTLQARPTA